MTRRKSKKSVSYTRTDLSRIDRTPRSTFRVARAVRRVARELPELHLGVDARLAARDRRPLDVPAVPLAPPPVASRPSRPVRDDPRPERGLTLERPQVCKDRPAARRGGGSGRSFVPWCSRRS